MDAAVVRAIGVLAGFASVAHEHCRTKGCIVCEAVRIVDRNWNHREGD